jgi:hypothetical protein
MQCPTYRELSDGSEMSYAQLAVVRRLHRLETPVLMNTNTLHVSARHGACGVPMMVDGFKSRRECNGCTCITVMSKKQRGREFVGPVSGVILTSGNADHDCGKLLTVQAVLLS